MYVALPIDLDPPRIETNKKHGAGREAKGIEKPRPSCATGSGPVQKRQWSVLANGSGLEFQSREMREPY
jgi:hypothetical protein